MVQQNTQAQPKAEKVFLVTETTLTAFYEILENNIPLKFGGIISSAVTNLNKGLTEFYPDQFAQKIAAIQKSQLTTLQQPSDDQAIND